MCQFSYPPTPVLYLVRSFHYEDRVVKSYARDLSESVIQEAFIELSQVDVTFTTKAAVKRFPRKHQVRESTKCECHSTDF